MQLSKRKKKGGEFSGALKMAQKANGLFPDLQKIPELVERCKALKKIPRLLAKCEVLYLMIEVGLSQLNGGHHPWTSSSKMQGRSNTNFKKDEKEPRTFTSCCPSCMVSCSIYKVYENQLLLCHKCQSTFVAHDLCIEGVQPESSGYKFADHKDSPSQGRSEIASQSNDGTENPSVTRFNGNAALSPVSKARTAADGSRGSKSNPEKNDIRHEVGVGKVGFQMSKSSLESGESFKTGNKARADSGQVELNGGYRLRRSSRKRQSIC